LNIFGVGKEKRTQLFFRDDGKFTFRKLTIQDTFMVEKKGDDILKGWKHFFKLQFPFAGYKGMQPDMVSLAYDRDIILDPYGIVAENDKPDKRKKMNENPWITEIAETQRYKHQSNPSSQFVADKIVLIVGGFTFLMVIGIFILALK